MSPRLATPFAVLILCVGAAAADEPAFVLDPGMHAYPPVALLATADGKTVVTIGGAHGYVPEPAVRGWDAATGKQKFVLWLPPETRHPMVGTVGGWLSPDGRWLAVRAGPARPNQARLCLIPLADRGTYRFIAEHDRYIESATFSPDGAALATAGRDVANHTGAVKVWDVATGRLRHTLDPGPRRWPQAVAFSPDGNRLAASVGDADGRGAVRVWDAATGRLEREIDSPRGASRLSWSPDSKTLAVTDHANIVRLTSARTGAVSKVVGVYGDAPAAGGFTAAGGYVAVWGAAETITVRDESAGKDLARLPAVPGASIWAEVAPGGRAFVFAGPGRELVCLDLPTGKEVRRFRVAASLGRVVGWSADGSRLAWGTADDKGRAAFTHTLRLADLTAAAADPKETFTGERRDWGKTRLTRVGNHDVTVESGGRAVTTPPFEFDVEGDGINAATLLDGGNKVLLATTSMELAQFDARTGKKELNYGSPLAYVTTLAPSADGQLFAVGTGNPVLQVYRTGRPGPRLNFYPAGDEWLAWTPAGDWAASANGGRLVGTLTRPEPGKLQTFVPYPAARNRPDAVKAALRP